MVSNILTAGCSATSISPSFGADRTRDYDEITPMIGLLTSWLVVDQMEIPLGGLHIVGGAFERGWSFRERRPAGKTGNHHVVKCLRGHRVMNCRWPLRGESSFWLMASKKRGMTSIQPQGSELFQPQWAWKRTQRLGWESQAPQTPALSLVRPWAGDALELRGDKCALFLNYEAYVNFVYSNRKLI